MKIITFEAVDVHFIFTLFCHPFVEVIYQIYLQYNKLSRAVSKNVFPQTTFLLCTAVIVLISTRAPISSYSFQFAIQRISPDHATTKLQFDEI